MVAALKSILNSRVPASCRGALRISICVWVLMILGDQVKPGGAHSSLANSWKVGCQWGAITAVFNTAPAIGACAQVGAERVVATLVGACLAYAAIQVCHLPIFLATISGLVAFGGFVIGEKYNVSYGAGKLLAVTFIVVTMAFPHTATLAAVVSRFIGICGGVLICLLAAILVFPSAASTKAFTSPRLAMQALVQLHKICWEQKRELNALLSNCTCHEIKVKISNDITIEDSSQAAAANQQAGLKEMVTVFEELEKFKGHLRQSENELFLGAACGTSWYMPLLPGMLQLFSRMPIFSGSKAILPAVKLNTLVHSLQETQATMYSMATTVLEGFDGGTCDKIKASYPPQVLDQLRFSSLEALEGAVAAYTLEGPITELLGDSKVAVYKKAVDDLLCLSAEKQVAGKNDSEFGLDAHSPNYMPIVPEPALKAVWVTPIESSPLPSGCTTPLTSCSAISILSRTDDTLRERIPSLTHIPDFEPELEDPPAVDAYTSPTSFSDAGGSKYPFVPSEPFPLPSARSNFESRHSSSSNDSDLTRAELCAHGSEDFLGKVRWMTFHFTASKLAGDLQHLYGAINDVLPHLPNATIRPHSLQAQG